MTRAFNQVTVCFCHFGIYQKPSRAESLWVKARTARPPDGCPWNQKKLDYEIETHFDWWWCLGSRWLETKRNSITRLKLCELTRPMWTCFLETKRNSITRLKHSRKHNRREYQQLSWNQKKLDYEIETWCGGNMKILCIVLKPKETRLRDWNFGVLCHSIALVAHLKPKETRLRDWNEASVNSIFKPDQHLKPKETRLRDWNLTRKSNFWESVISGCLKPKETRLRDWNDACISSDNPCWFLLETKRNSITRLKQAYFYPTNTYIRIFLKPKETRLRDWNFLGCVHLIPSLIWLETKRNSITRLKRTSTTSHTTTTTNLETKRNSITRLKLNWRIATRHWSSVLETKRNSITRLKLRLRALTQQTLILTWNQKKLDYEIETVKGINADGDFTGDTWNQKKLDYEIETKHRGSW